MLVDSTSRLLYLTVARLGSGTAHEAYVVQLGRAFASSGCEMTIAAASLPNAIDGLVGRFGELPVGMNFLSLGHATDRPSLLAYMRLALRLWIFFGRTDQGRSLCITHHPLLAWAAALRGLPWIYDVHQIEPRGRLLRPLLRLRSCKGVLFNSSAARAKFERLYGALQIPALVSHNAIDPEHFLDTPSQADARLKLGIPKDATVMVYAGSIGAGRGIEELIDTALTIDERYPRRCIWAIVGGRGQDFEHLVQMCKERGGTAQFVTPGAQQSSRLPLWYAAADCLLAPYSARLPAADIMNPMKLYEYAAAGRPILASDLPTVREALNGHSGYFLFAPDSHDAMVCAVKRFLTDPAELMAAATVDRPRALANTWQAKTAEILDWLKGAGYDMLQPRNCS